MKNAEEHKKLLAQIAELEKNSVNYFDVEKEFFLIDSDNLSQVRPKLYGYSIQATGIYEDDNLTPEAVANLDGRGCYVYVEVKEGKITIKQDLNGCWGIYLFRHGDYFALSNSFFRLIDHIKFRYPLTVNRDYCHFFILSNYATHAYLETAVNEIRLIERNAIIQIGKETKTLEIDLIDYKSHTVPVDSEEGIATLDRWFEFWTNVFYGLTKHTKCFRADLSGGIDSRITFAVLLNSGVDLSKIQIFSNTNKLHTHREDYEIASKITDHYGLKLNQPIFTQRVLKCSLCDIFNVDLYHQQMFRLLFLNYSIINVDKVYHLRGLSGEVIRDYWYASPKKITESRISFAKARSNISSREITDAIEAVLKRGFRAIRDKYKINDEDSPLISQYLYQETAGRSHHGKEALGAYLYNVITPGIFFDPELETLQINTAQCPDPKLLISVIFTRYEPDLLKFPFDSGHSIPPKTIEYAKKINERFPRRVTTDKSSRGEQAFHLQPRDLQAEKILAEGKNNPNIPSGFAERCLKAMFESSRTYGLFTAYFDEELYRYAANYFDTNGFGRYRPMYAVCGVAKVLEDVEISQRNHSPYRDMQRFIEQDFTKIPKEPQFNPKFKTYLTARVDVKLISSAGDFQIVSVSDEKATVWKPGWFNRDGIGYQIQSYAGNMEIVAKATVNSQIRLNLLGLDVRTPEDRSKRIPYWIDYTKLTVNGKVIFDKLTPAWHDKPFRYSMDAKAGDEIKIQVEWLPHRSDT